MTPPLKSTWVGQARPLAPASDRRGDVAAAAVCRVKEPREVPRDGGVGRVRQADLLKPDAALPCRHRVARHRREEPVEQHLIHVVDRQRRLDRAADQTGTAAEERHRPLALRRDRSASASFASRH